MQLVVFYDCLPGPAIGFLAGCRMMRRLIRAISPQPNHPNCPDRVHQGGMLAIGGGKAGEDERRDEEDESTESGGRRSRCQIAGATRAAANGRCAPPPTGCRKPPR